MRFIPDKTYLYAVKIGYDPNLDVRWWFFVNGLYLGEREGAD